MTSNDNPNDLWSTSNEDDGFFGSEEPVEDMFAASSELKPDAPGLPEEEVVTVPTQNSMSVAPLSAPVSKSQTDGYVVLARKYRPQTFDDIIGQEGVQQALRGAIATGQVSHSYLFSGPRGTGKTSTARILAKALNCQNEGPRPDPCGRCASCRSITVGSSLDVIEIDAASNTGVDNIRELKSGVVLAPFSRYKVYIVDEVHMLSNQAFNALLKTLEEPPAQVIFILATTELHKVPETIISRCQTFMFRRFSLTELKNQLSNILTIEAENRGLTVSDSDREKILDLIARNAEGGMRDAQVTLDQVLVLSKGIIDFESVRRFLGMADTEALDSFVQFINERKSRELLKLIDQLVTAGQDLELFVKGACEHMRDLLLIKCAGRDTPMINVSEDRAKDLESIAEGLSSQSLVSAIDQFIKVVGEMKVSGQPRIILELAVLKLTLQDPGKEIQNIIKRLDTLESAVKSGHLTPSNNVVSQAEVAGGVAPVKFQPASISSDPAQKSSDSNGRDIGPGTESISEAPPVSSRDMTLDFSAAEMVDKIGTKLKSDFGMLSLTFEKVLCGQDFEGDTLTLQLNEAVRMSYSQMIRPQNTDTVIRVSRSLFGPQLNVRFKSINVPLSSTTSAVGTATDVLQESPDDTASLLLERSDDPLVTESIHLGSQASATAQAEPDRLKIYYPDEIREKTMLPVHDAEFLQMMESDNALKELVEKTKRIFGVDDKYVKFHRSTLA